MKKSHVPPKGITLSKSSLDAIERYERGAYKEYTVIEFLNELSTRFPQCKDYFDRLIELTKIVFDEYKFPTVFYNDLPLNLYKSPKFIDKENTMKKIIPDKDFTNYLRNILQLCLTGSTIIDKRFQYQKLGKQRLRNRKELSDNYGKFKGFASFIVLKNDQNIKEKDIICFLTIRNNTLYLCNIDTYENVYMQGPLPDVPI